MIKKTVYWHGIVDWHQSTPVLGIKRRTFQDASERRIIREIEELQSIGQLPHRFRNIVTEKT